MVRCIVLVLFLLLGCSPRTYIMTDSLGKTKVQEGNWQEFMERSGADHVYEVNWEEKDNGVVTEYCKVVYYNVKEREYKLVAPWLNKIVKNTEIYNIYFTKVFRKEMSDNYRGRNKIK